jgi:hypothetical protein
MTKESPNGKHSNDLMSKSKLRPSGGMGEGAKKEHKKPWRENLISLKMILMPSHAMLRK